MEKQNDNVKEINFKKDIEKEFIDLKRRIKKTRGSRIEASKRLRMKHSYYEKVTHFYSLIVLILSLWFLNQDGETGVIITKILLVMSLSLTYFTMFLSLRNYKERAGNFETNYQQLDVLTNRLDRFASSGKELTEQEFKQFQREYEKLIIGKENHQNIDFYLAKKAEDRSKEDDYAIKYYKFKEKVMNISVAIYPILILIMIFVFLFIVSLFDK